MNKNVLLFFITCCLLSLHTAYGQTCQDYVKYTPLPYTQGFESWVNLCDSLDAPDSSWTNTPATGDNSWRRDDQGPLIAWDAEYSDQYTAVEGSYYARFNIYAPPASTGTLDLHVNCSTAGTKLLTFDYINQESGDNMVVSLSVDSGATFTQIANYTEVDNWKLDSLLILSNSPKTIIRFVATSDYGYYDMGLDNLNLDVLSPCNGMPDAPVLSAAQVYSFGVPYASTITIVNPIYASGISYQWQSSSDSLDWTTIPGATNLTYTANVNVTTYYRVYTTCAASNLSDSSAGIQLQLQPYPACAGTPVAGTISATQTSNGIPYISILSLDNPILETGILYQWQSSPDSISWTDISGATNLIDTAYVSATTYYRINVTCANSNLSGASAGIKLQYQSSVENPDAQQGSTWAFGLHAGVNFSSGVPVAVQTAISDPYSGYGSVCNASGQLLFYTDGDTIYNKYGQIMPNGSGLTGLPFITAFGISPVAGVTQGVLVVPMPDSIGKYYVFSTSSSQGYSSFLGSTDTLLFGRLSYSVVDMSLNGGWGDVEPGRKGIVLDTNIVAGITGIPGSDCSIWLLYRTLPHLQFKAYNINVAGINSNPVVSGGAFTDTFSTYNLPNGYLAVAPNHAKIASGMQLFNFGPLNASGYLQLFDFDSATGIVSNSNISLDFGSDPLDGVVKSLCFSPDNSKLYCTGRLNANINQFDLTATDSASFVNSETYIGTCDQSSELQIAPNGKIYFITDATDLGDIDAPNLAGGACGYNPYAVQSLNGTQFGGFDGLPNIVPVVRQDTGFVSVDTAVVSGTAIAAPSGYSSYLWNDGTTNAQKTITTAGIYWVTFSNYYCEQHVDSFQVSISNAGVPSIANTSMDVYPNPAQSEITITINAVGQVSGNIQIVNVLGQVVLQQPCTQNKQTLNVRNLETGAYIINYISKNAGMPTLKAHILICK